MIKFEHSVFALPFALTGALLAIRESGFDRAGLGWKLGWIVVAMAAARVGRHGVQPHARRRHRRAQPAHALAAPARGAAIEELRLGIHRGRIRGVLLSPRAR